MVVLVTSLVVSLAFVSFSVVLVASESAARFVVLESSESMFYLT